MEQPLNDINIDSDITNDTTSKINKIKTHTQDTDKKKLRTNKTHDIKMRDKNINNTH